MTHVVPLPSVLNVTYNIKDTLRFIQQVLKLNVRVTLYFKDV